MFGTILFILLMFFPFKCGHWSLFPGGATFRKKKKKKKKSGTGQGSAGTKSGSQDVYTKVSPVQSGIKRCPGHHGSSLFFGILSRIAQEP